MKRKISSLILFVSLLFLAVFDYDSVSASIYSKQTDTVEEATYVEEWLMLNNLGRHVVSDPTDLYSVSGEKVAIKFNVDKNGYVVLSLKNYDIMEYSFASSPKIDSAKKNIYNGFLCYYEEKGNELVDVITKKKIEKNDVEDFFKKLPQMSSVKLSEKVEALKELKNEKEILPGKTVLKAAGNGFFENGSLNHSLVTWSSSYYYCQVDSAAILLRYLYDYKWNKFLPSGYTSNNNVQSYLCTNKYLTNAPMWSNNVVNGGTENGVKFSGMKKYLLDRGISTWAASFETYSFNRIKTLINSDIPVVHASNGYVPGNTWSNGAHAYVIHGYMVGYDGVPYMYVNDTFGSNGIGINASVAYHPTSYDGIWYIS